MKNIDRKKETEREEFFWGAVGVGDVADGGVDVTGMMSEEPLAWLL